MDDLSLALGEHGVNVRKPDYCQCPLISGYQADAQTYRINFDIHSPIVSRCTMYQQSASHIPHE